MRARVGHPSPQPRTEACVPDLEISAICNRRSTRASTPPSTSSALLSAGELRFAQGAARHAASDAERALAVDPYLERAHRLAIAAHLHGHQPGRAVAAAARAQNALDELGVDPEPATAMLMRQAAAWPPAGQGVARAS